MTPISRQPDDAAAEATAVARVRAALDASVGNLDAEVIERLAAARRLAVNGMPRARSAPARWQPALAMAATLSMTFVLWSQIALPPLPLVDDPLETVVAQEMELLEDLEFAAWMLAEADNGSAAAADSAG